MPADIWAAGASQPSSDADEPAVYGVKEFTSTHIEETVGVRRAWLSSEGRPMNFQMKWPKRCDFLAFAKKQYHSEELQEELQARDYQQGLDDGGTVSAANKKLKTGMHSRWGRELQRRCGSKVFWELVSFTGNFDLGFRSESWCLEGCVSQPTDPGLKRELTQARSDLRWGEHVKRNKNRISTKEVVPPT